MAQITKAAVLAAEDIKFETVAVPEWGGDVRIRSMTAFARDQHEQWLMNQPDDGAGKRIDNFRAHMVALSAVDEDGELMFAAEDIPALGNKSASAIGRIYDAVVALNVISAKDVDALVKK